jgi:hypothetical protein
MTDGRGWRFALEVAFLVGLAVVLGVADVDPLVVVATMVVGWVLVALLEWASWREEPHWGSGSPPRYYVPPTELPPRRAVDLRYEQGYPAPQREVESPTWIATPEMRRAVLGAWPVPAPAADGDELVEEVEVAAVAAAAEPAPAPIAVAEPAPASIEVVEETDGEPLEDALVQEAAAVATLEDAPVAADDEPSPDEQADPNGIDPWEVQAFPREPVAVGARPSRHRIDPLVEPEGRRWPWQRGGGSDGVAATEFPTRPRHAALPRRGGDG